MKYMALPMIVKNKTWELSTCTYLVTFPVIYIPSYFYLTTYSFNKMQTVKTRILFDGHNFYIKSSKADSAGQASSSGQFF